MKGNTAMKLNLSTKDLITTGVFSGLYFVIVTIITFSCMFLLPGLGNFLLPSVCALLVGPIYFVLLDRVPKFGVITILSSVMGVFMLLTGHFPLSFIPNFLFGILADCLTHIGSRNKVKDLAGYILFSFGLIGPLLPLWFMKDQYINDLVRRGKDTVYIDQTFSYVSNSFLVIIILLILLLSIVGGLYGQKMVKKHFNKDGQECLD
ncbi:hypothetical protein CBF31_02325 [Vagococcus fessus]|uniref:Uncharacterized protein n=2 Tax=Vagococcus fessus TaxID=120370 RepID=A0A430ACD6_9ENTE|nr:hypothetical protein CBF31_02325 [Vagococcus fessus]